MSDNSRSGYIATMRMAQKQLDSPCSSFSSDASSCGKSSPQSSFIGLRRSTLDLSQIHATGLSRPSKQVSSKDARSTDKSCKSQETPSILGFLRVFEAILGHLLDAVSYEIGTLFRILFSVIFGWKFVEPVVPSHKEEDLQATPLRQQTQEENIDAPLSPARIESNDDDDSKGGWGHFADFREELADASLFIPSCSVNTIKTHRDGNSSSSSSLGVLDEEEEDDDAICF